MLWRLLFPSWAFFDAITDVPRLEIRGLTENGVAGPWRAALAAPARGRWAVLYHPEGTAHLAMQAIVDRLAVEQESGEHDGTTVALVAAVAAWSLEERTHERSDHTGAAHGQWQWRIVAVDALHPHAVRTIYESRPEAFPS
ncbi:hypothetical protein [Gemmatimonas phototrophica]|uniref:Uncharacterized protein n=1 Tax=Gemmatimonas phototrophica TaxID=1379270 RepID=A0A143BLW1_9BACT|nr:hypothetical protein [Gemmatimonas phototrophica]AMW05998.1 hypothetical protein GEMMAAP_16795 [Gemmatimonas phototrophica]